MYSPKNSVTRRRYNKLSIARTVQQFVVVVDVADDFYIFPPKSTKITPARSVGDFSAS